jgi:hypothetical protein
MKKTRIAFLLAMLMICSAMLAACGGGGGKKWEKVLDGSLYEAETAFAAATKVAALSEKEFEEGEGVLACFVSETVPANEGDPVYEVLTVYSFAENKEVYTATESKTVKYDISLGEINGVSFFTVVITTYAMEDDVVNFTDFTKKTLLYDAAGTQKASADGAASLSRAGSFYAFGDAYYKVNEKDGIVKAYDKNPLASTPYLYQISDNYYIGRNGSSSVATFYDQDLKVVSSFVLPDYAIETGGGMIDEDKYLIQYKVKADAYTEEYDILGEDGKKYELYTVIFNIEKGKMKEIECDYYIEDDVYYFATAVERADYGLNEKITAVAEVYPIVDKRIDYAIDYLASVSENGKISLFEKLNGFDVVDIYPFAENLFKIYTADNKEYLVNEKFEVIGDISGDYERNEKYILAGGKVFDFTLKEVLDYEDKALEVQYIFVNTILFSDEDGAFFLFADGSLKALTSTKTVEGVEVPEKMIVPDQEHWDAGIYVIGDMTDEENPLFKLYNADGKLLLSLAADNYFDFELVDNTEEWTLIAVEGYDEENEKDTLDYYVIK